MDVVTLQNMPRQTGWIEVITGCMFSGKTEELIRRLRRAQIAKQSVVIFKPRIDTRFPGVDLLSAAYQADDDGPILVPIHARNQKLRL